ncbi:MAG: DinB family protein [Phycisphaerales bacterium]
MPAPTSSAPLAPRPPARDVLAPLPHRELVLRYRVGVENFDPRVLKLSDAQLDRGFAAGDGVGLWSCRVLLGHLADAELSFVHRLRRVAAEDAPVFSVWDENAFIESGLYGRGEDGRRFPIGAFVAAIHTLRQWTSEWLGTLSDEQWARRGLHPQRGEQTLRTILEYATWHVEHHAWYLHRKLAILTGA